jgi:uncharacterized protein (TIGR01244 family)
MKRMLQSYGLPAAVALFAAAVFGATCAEIDKFYWMDHRVATGGQPKTGELAALKREGFRTIVNLRQTSEYDAEAEAAEARRLGLGYVSIPVDSAAPRDEQVDSFLAAMKDKKLWPVFVHCGSGNRVAAFWMIHRVIVDGWEMGDAEFEARLVGLRSASLLEFAHEYICRYEKAETHAIPCANRSGGTD